MGQLPNGRVALTNGRIVMPNEVITGKTLVIESGKIIDLTNEAAVGTTTETIDVEGRLITPGLIDIHTHGALGHSFTEATAEAFATITRENARRGVTALLATSTTAPIQDLVKVLEFARQWMEQTRNSESPGTQVLGVHVEGPYFCVAQAGAQDPANVRNPADGTPAVLLEHHDVIKLMSYAPELPGAIGLTAQLTELGIVAAAGHSNAKAEEVQAAMDAGLRHIIHIWSGQSSMVREGPWRKPGLLEASLVFDGLTVEMISDNKHLPPLLMQLAYKCIGPDRLCAISDATNGAGLPDGSRFTMGDLEYDVHDGVGMMLDRSGFAGSTTLLNQMIPILINVVGIPLPEAVRMGSLTPARVIGVDNRKGSLEIGKDADIAIFDDAFSAWRTMINGKWVSTNTHNK
jgi:N-acetylglucosamine-6-phosphate deacetylase